MQYRRLGNSGLKISEVSLGGNNFGWMSDEKNSIAVVEYALDAGINYIDTADVYDKGASEEFIGKAIKGKRSQVLIATKFGSLNVSDNPNGKGGSRYNVLNAVEASLRRLQTDYVDVYQMHYPDPTTPIEETLRALDDIVRAGKVRYIGCSNYAAWQLSEAMWTSKVNNLHAFATVQSKYNLLERQIEKSLVPCCQAHDVGVIPWGPLAGGFLTGKYRKGQEPPKDGRLTDTNSRIRIYNSSMTEENWDKLARWEAFATERGHTVGELAIAWLLAKPWISSVIAGARKPEQITANIAAGEWKLTAEEAAEVDSL